jgi:hypothetical protein
MMYGGGGHCLYQTRQTSRYSNNTSAGLVSLLFISRMRMLLDYTVPVQNTD